MTEIYDEDECVKRDEHIDTTYFFASDHKHDWYQFDFNEFRQSLFTGDWKWYQGGSKGGVYKQRLPPGHPALIEKNEE